MAVIVGAVLWAAGAADAILATLAVALLRDEAKAWMPTLTEHLIRRCLNRVPAELRERLDEEWHGHAAGIPGEIGKLIFALRLLPAPRRIAADRRLAAAIRSWEVSMAEYSRVKARLTATGSFADLFEETDKLLADFDRQVRPFYRSWGVFVRANRVARALRRVEVELKTRAGLPS